MKEKTEQKKNVLIVDPYQRTCFLIKSILLGANYRVSIAKDWKFGMRKLETGLFDLLLVDVESREELENVRRYVIGDDTWQKLLPVGLITSMQQEVVQDVGVDVIIKKPIRINQVLKATKSMREIGKARKKKLQNDFDQLSVECNLVLDSESPVGPDDKGLECRAVSLNPGGMLAEPHRDRYESLEHFHEYFSNVEDQIFRADFYSGEEGISVPARKVFEERTPDEKIREVGFQFAQKPDRTQETLSRLMDIRAPGGTGVEGTG